MGSPLGPVIAGIFMVELETQLLPNMSSFMLPWVRYVDDTLTAIKPDAINAALSIMNGFDNNISFTHEIENNGTIPFLDVLLLRSDEGLESTVYGKETNKELYIHRRVLYFSCLFCFFL